MKHCCICKVVKVGTKRLLCVSCENKQVAFINKGRQNVKRKVVNRSG